MFNLSAVLALLCAIHCALTPILLTVTPVFASRFAENHWLEWILIGASVALGAFPLLKGFAKQHGNMVPGTLFAMGFSFILGAHFFHIGHISHGVTFLGAVLLIGAQWHNARLAHQCKVCEVEHS